VNVSRLAAIDMYGLSGSARRRRLMLAEFVVAVIGMVGIGLWVLAQAPAAGTRVFVLWPSAPGSTYAKPMYALILSRPVALENELAGLDPRAELRGYPVSQLWVLVPPSLIAMALQMIKSDRWQH
jgi:hypothetical protein